jgi:transcriptional regulator with XRE-family HTH domain
VTADEIITLRECLGWTRKKLADHLGCSVSAVETWERGTAQARPDTRHKLNKLAETVDVIPRRKARRRYELCGCGGRRQTGNKCEACGAYWSPSPEEIAAATAEIRGKWTPSERDNRSGWMIEPKWEVPRIRKR